MKVFCLTLLSFLLMSQSFGSEELLEKLSCGKFEEAKILIENGANINYVSTRSFWPESCGTGISYHQTVMYSALRASDKINVDFIQYLLSKGAKHSLDDFNYTFYVDDPKVMGFFLKELGYVSQMTDGFICASLLWPNNQSFEAILANGLSPNYKMLNSDDDDEVCSGNFLSEAVFSDSDSYFMDIAFNRIALLSKYGFKIESTDDTFNIFMSNIENGFMSNSEYRQKIFDVIDQLVLMGFDINRFDNSIRTPLHSLLSNFGSNDNDEGCGDDGDTPPERCSIDDRYIVSILKKLVDKGADINLENGSGKNAYKIAKSRGLKKAKKYLKSLISR